MRKKYGRIKKSGVVAPVSVSTIDKIYEKFPSATCYTGDRLFWRASDIAGIKDFQGDHLTHSAYFTQPDRAGKGKKAIVVGYYNSRNNIAGYY